MAEEKEKQKAIARASSTGEQPKNAKSTDVVSYSLKANGSQLLDISTYELGHYLTLQHRVQSSYMEEFDRLLAKNSELCSDLNANVLIELRGANGQQLLEKVASHNLIGDDKKPLSRNELAVALYSHLTSSARAEKMDRLLNALAELKLVVYSQVRKSKGGSPALVRYEVKPTMKLKRLLMATFNSAVAPLQAVAEPLGES